MLVSSNCNTPGRCFGAFNASMDYRKRARWSGYENCFGNRAASHVARGVPRCRVRCRTLPSVHLGVTGHSEFRAERDFGVWVALLITGLLLGVTAFVAAQALDAHL
jgi:hypothetical protein